MTNRRNFLKGLAGVIAAAAAPAVVSEPMKLWRPERKLYVPDQPIYIGVDPALDFGDKPFSVSSWLQVDDLLARKLGVKDDEWFKVETRYNGHTSTVYVNGSRVDNQKKIAQNFSGFGAKVLDNRMASTTDLVAGLLTPESRLRMSNLQVVAGVSTEEQSRFLEKQRKSLGEMMPLTELRRVW